MPDASCEQYDKRSVQLIAWFSCWNHDNPKRCAFLSCKSSVLWYLKRALDSPCPRVGHGKTSAERKGNWKLLLKKLQFKDFSWEFKRTGATMIGRKMSVSQYLSARRVDGRLGQKTSLKEANTFGSFKRQINRSCTKVVEQNMLPSSDFQTGVVLNKIRIASIE